MIHEIKQPDCNDADKVLDAAKGKLKNVVIIAETADEQRYYASTTSFKPAMLWMAAEFIFSLFGCE